MKKNILLIVLLLNVFVSVVSAEDEPQEWAKGTVWYKILPERFRNINPANDPIKKNVVGDTDYDWQVHPWASDWFKLQVWEKERNEPFSKVVADRRYGGDLIGVIEKLPYLQSLGVDVIYLTPIFESGAIEKYDATTFHHIDNNFGIDRDGDYKKNSEEDENPENWTVTKADEIFFELVQQAHELKMKVVVEAVFTYCSEDFFAFRDLKENQEKSKYKDWFEVTSWDVPATPDTVEFSYKAWQGDPKKPLFRIDANGSLTAPVKKYIFDVTSRWTDPDTNAVTADGIDGWAIRDRLPTADKFWHEWNEHVRKLNKKVVTITENTDNAGFTFKTDDELSSQILRFFSDPKMEQLEEFSQKLNKIMDKCSKEENTPTFAQLSDIHSLRFPSAIVNSEKLNQLLGKDVSESKGFSPLKPDSTQHKLQKLMTVFQLTYPASPFLLYGDESGMWGAGYADNLKPMLWNEFLYEKESYKTVSPTFAKTKNKNEFDQGIFNIYRKLNNLRKETNVLVKGEYAVEFLDKENGIFAYSRRHLDEVLFVFMNLSDQKQQIVYNPGWKKNHKVKDVFSLEKLKMDKHELKLELEPKGFRVLMKE